MFGSSQGIIHNVHVPSYTLPIIRRLFTIRVSLYLVVIVWETIVVGGNGGYELGTCESEHVFKSLHITGSGVSVSVCV